HFSDRFPGRPKASSVSERRRHSRKRVGPLLRHRMSGYKDRFHGDGEFHAACPQFWYHHLFEMDGWWILEKEEWSCTRRATTKQSRTAAKDLDENHRKVRVMGCLSDDGPREAERDECRLRATGMGCDGKRKTRPPYARSGRHCQRRRS